MSFRRVAARAALLVAIPALAFANPFYFSVVEEMATSYSAVNSEINQVRGQFLGPSLMFEGSRFGVQYGRYENRLYCTNVQCGTGTDYLSIKRWQNTSGGTLGTIFTGAGGHTSSYLEPGYRNVYYLSKGRAYPGAPEVDRLWQAWQAVGSGGWNHVHVDGGKTDSGANLDGVSVSMQAVYYGGTGHIFYVETGLGLRLRHVWWDIGTGSWKYEVLDGDGGANGRINADFSVHPDGLSVVVNGNDIHVFYFDVTNGALRRAYSGGSGWWFETVPTGPHTVAPPFAAVLFDGHLHAFVRDSANSDLVWVPGYWGYWNAPRVLDGHGVQHGSSPASLATTDAVATRFVSATAFDGRIQVFYDGLDGRTLRHAEVIEGDIAFQGLQNFVSNTSSARLSSVASGAGNGYLAVVTTVYIPGDVLLSQSNETRVYLGRRCSSITPCPF